LLAIALSSCGGGSAASAALIGAEPVLALPVGAEQLPALPPGEIFNPSRITAAVTTMRDGVVAYDHNAANVTLVGPHAAYAPAAGELAWAIYEFPGSTADELGEVKYFTSNRGTDNEVWMAISNYAGDAWEFLGSRNQDAGAFVPPGGDGDYASPAGHTYLMVLGWDGVSFDLDKVEVTYANRYAVTGQVVDMGGVGIPMTTVTTTLGGPGVMTDAAGNFTLPSIPEGTWHIMATKPAWVFYDNPQEFTVSGGPLSGVQLIGDMNESHFAPVEDNEPNDAWWEAPNMDPSTPVEEFISVSDDSVDFYRFAFSTPGQYFFRLDADPSVLFPHIDLYTKEGTAFAYSAWVGSGVVYVPVTVATTRVVLAKVTCSGGGGNYVLSTGMGNLNSLTGYVENPATDELEYVLVECDAGSELTYLYTDISYGKYIDNYMAPVATTVTPDPFSEDPYTYVPPGAVANLNLGDVIMPVFTGNAVFLGDGFEPNDTALTAHVFGSLPVSGDVANINGTDHQDWYRFTPAVGKYLLVRLHYDYTRNQYGGNPLFVYLYNHDQSLSSWAYATDQGLEVRTSEAMVGDGNEFYVNVNCYDIRTYEYELWIEEVDAYKLEVGGLWDGFGLEGARVHLTSEDYGWTQEFTTAHSGLTEIPYMFLDGEEVFAEIFRYGTTLDRNTKHLIIDGGDTKYWFRCKSEECEDSWESNDLYGKYADYPFNFDATLSGYSDPTDRYLFTPASADPVRVIITSPSSDCQFNCRIVNNVTDMETDYFVCYGGGDFLMETDGPVEHYLEIGNYLYEEEASYHLSTEETPGYMLTGEVVDNVASPVNNAYLYCPALNQQWWSVQGSPSAPYELGPFMPGSYQIYVYAPNYDPTPGSPFTLNIASGDETQDFVLTPNYTDTGEPNNTSGTASGPLVSGVPVEANVDGNSDDYDYWSFTVPGPTLLNAYTIFENGFAHPYLVLYDTDGSTNLANSSMSNTTYQRIDYYLPAAGTYYLMVSCTFGANDYSLTANF